MCFAVGDGLRLPFDDSTFDHVVLAEVLEHLPDHAAALGEARRVLRPAGTLAVSVPRFLPEWICWRLSRAYHEVEGGHVRIFREGVLRRMLRAHGFRIVERRFAHALHSPYWWLQCARWEARERSALVRAYHRFLVWDLTARPRVTRLMERALNPLIGKSLVLYCAKEGAA
jgi:ubiquinone/menaquinone biosynthesis C-methylase UbiE